MTPGLLSVVLPNYNHAAYVGGQIRAVLAQSYRNLELIIIDDASTDHSVAEIEKAIGSDPRVTLVKNEKNRGVQPNVAHGASLAKGEFIYFCAADDRVLPGLFEKTIKMLQDSPQAGVAFTQMAWIENNGTVARPMPLRLTQQATFLTPDQFCDVMCGEHLTGHSAILRRELFEKALPPRDEYDALKWHGDWLIATILACRHGACYIPEPLIGVRVAEENFSVQGMYKFERQKVVVKTAIRILKSDPFRDVLPYFVRGALFSGIPLVAQTVLADPDLWDMESMLLAQKCISDWNVERREFQKSRWVTR